MTANSNSRDLELIRQIEARRNDPQFMSRLRRIVNASKDILDRLDDSPQGGSPTHMQFVGGTIYCGVKGSRLNLGTDHRYGQSFHCPYCYAYVSGRLEASE